MQHHSTIDAKCSKCQAEPGQKCKNFKGKEIDRCHADRVLAPGVQLYLTCQRCQHTYLYYLPHEPDDCIKGLFDRVKICKI